MTTMHFAEIAAAIADLAIAGVKIHDLDDMPDAIDPRRCPVLGPSANDPSFLTDWESTRVSLGGNRAVAYTLNYKLYQAPVGTERGLFKLYPAMVETAQAIADHFNGITVVSGAQHIKLEALPAFGPVSDASGQVFHGAVFSLRVTEF